MKVIYLSKRVNLLATVLATALCLLINSSCSSLESFEFETVKVDFKGQITERSKGRARYFSEDLGGVSLEMVEIPAGTFTMGSPKNESQRSSHEGPQHPVSLKQFYIGKFEVTKAQWKVIAGLPKIDLDLKPQPDHPEGDNQPVNWVTWDEAVEFCKRLSQKTGREYRLPTEAEWEYAARAGTTTPFAFGETLNKEVANFAEGIWIEQRKVKPTVEVGSLRVANAFGLYDTQGNVSEWCQDWYHGDYIGAPANGSAWIEGGQGERYRVTRGGGANTSIDVLRSAHRFQEQHDSRTAGFRIVSVSRP